VFQLGHFQIEEY